MIREEGALTTHLENIKLVLDIVCAAYCAWFFFDLMNRGQISYRVGWLWNRWREQQKAESRFRQDYGWMLYQAEQIVRGVRNG